MKIGGGWVEGLGNGFMTALEFITAALAISYAPIDLVEFIKHVLMLLQFIVDLYKHLLEVVAAPLVLHRHFMQLLRFFHHWQKSLIHLLLYFCNWYLLTIVFIHLWSKFSVLFVSRRLLANFGILRNRSSGLPLFFRRHSVFGFDKHFLKIKFLISCKIKIF